jgi:flagellar basal-body rod protein FlgB
MVEMPVAGALERYLSLNTQQMKLTAANIANVDTPGYKTTGIDFQGEFSRALDSRSVERSATITAVPGLTSRADGNNVSIDRESMEMAKTQLQFKTGVELLRHQYSQILDAIKSDTR